ncbi:hypothetical protein RR48_09997 [Papilio machaon]|uniref:Uncharacterized protein n=1 Tax=Papilio machaon TaxID=76193 RepID=A0A194RJ31_PAPMA|nr:hypothetical protein RR48_09997 [Papilio machaon]
MAYHYIVQYETLLAWEHSREQRWQGARGVVGGEESGEGRRQLLIVGCSAARTWGAARRGAGAADLAVSRLAARGRDDNARYFGPWPAPALHRTAAAVTNAPDNRGTRTTPERAHGRVRRASHVPSDATKATRARPAPTHSARRLNRALSVSEGGGSGRRATSGTPLRRCPRQ